MKKTSILLILTSLFIIFLFKLYNIDSYRRIIDFEKVIDPRLEYYYQEFKDDAIERGVHPNPNNYLFQIQIVKDLKTLEGRKVRGLSSSLFNTRVISIDEEVYLCKDRNFIQALMYHELGHAFFDLDHTVDYGIMDPRLFKYTSFKDPEKKEELIDNLFKY